MDKEVCVFCKKAIGNSLHKIQVDGIKYHIHKHCQLKFDCSNCLSMFIRKVEGQCICGKVN